MKNSLCFSKFPAALVLTFLSLGAANAQVLMFDFGLTTVTGASQTNSPYHSVNGSFADATWNKIQTADSSSLTWSDGTAATGVSINIGVTTDNASTTVGLGNIPSINSALGGTTSTGIYADTSVGKDGITTSSSGNTRYVGFQLGGLAAGTYDVYVSSRNTSTSNSYSQTLWLGSSLVAGDFDATALTLSDSLSYANGTVAISAWVVGENYFKLTLSLVEDAYLNLATVGGGNDNRGFLNSVQIVTVPEASSVVLLLGGLGLLAVRRRR